LSGHVYIVEDPDMIINAVLKLILLEPNGSENESKKNFQRMIERITKIGKLITKECDYFVSYLEVFEWKNFFCIKMEYFNNGSLQFQIDNKRIFTEEV
jgi:serine/threonine protein kinase